MFPRDSSILLFVMLAESSLPPQSTLRYILKHQPLLVTLENVDTLAEGSWPDRDVDYISTKLQSIGYAVWWSMFDALDHGSPAPRRRTYIVGLFKTKQSGAMVEHGHELLRTMKIGPGDISNSLIEGTAERAEFMDRVGILSEACPEAPNESESEGDPSQSEDERGKGKGKSKKGKGKQPVWKDQHNTYFRDYGLPYPPPKALRSASFCPPPTSASRYAAAS